MGAARRAGLSIHNRVRLRLPPRINFLGEHLLWTDPEYSSIVFGCPELFEDSLRALVEAGAAEEALELYFDEN